MCTYYDRRLRKHYNDYIMGFCVNEHLRLDLFFKLLEKIPEVGGKFKDDELGMNGAGDICIKRLRIRLVKANEDDLPKFVVKNLAGFEKNYFILRTSDKSAELFEAASSNSKHIQAEVSTVFLPC